MRRTTSLLAIIIIIVIISTSLPLVTPFTTTTTTKPCFSRHGGISSSSSNTHVLHSTTTEEAADFGSAMPKKLTAYDRIGFKEEEVALGIEPSDVLRWIGDREDMIEKFQEDNPKWSSERTSEEVSRFMMDAEMVNTYIAYEKRRADPEYQKKMAEKENEITPQVLSTYALWLTGGAGIAYAKNVIIEPKYKSGEWEPIHVDLGKFAFDVGGGFKGGGGGGADVVGDVAATTTVDGAGADAAGDVAATVGDVVGAAGGDVAATVGDVAATVSDVAATAGDVVSSVAN